MREMPIKRIGRHIILLFLVSSTISRANAGPITPVTYNVTDMGNLLATAGFDQSGNAIGQYSPTLNFVYTTSGPNAGQVQTVPMPDGLGPQYFFPASPPGFGAMAVSQANAAGQEIGTTFTITTGGVPIATAGWFYSGGQLSILPQSALPMVISARGQVVGDVTDANGNAHAFLYTNGQLTDLGTLSGGQSYGMGLNDKGQVVGWASLAGQGPSAYESRAAFLYENGQMYNLSSLINTGYLPTQMTSAFAINDLGQILVEWQDGDGDTRFYLLTPSDLPTPPAPPPIPESSTLAVFGLAIAAFGTRRMLRTRRGSRHKTKIDHSTLMPPPNL